MAEDKATITNLELEISSSGKQAAEGIDALAAAFERLSKAGLGDIHNQLKTIADSFKTITREARKTSVQPFSSKAAKPATVGTTVAKTPRATVDTGAFDALTREQMKYEALLQRQIATHERYKEVITSEKAETGNLAAAKAAMISIDQRVLSQAAKLREVTAQNNVVNKQSITTMTTLQQKKSVLHSARERERLAITQLNSAMQSGVATNSQVVAAQERVAAAKRAVAKASEDVVAAQERENATATQDGGSIVSTLTGMAGEALAGSLGKAGQHASSLLTSLTGVSTATSGAAGAAGGLSGVLSKIPGVGIAILAVMTGVKVAITAAKTAASAMLKVLQIMATVGTAVAKGMFSFVTGIVGGFKKIAGAGSGILRTLQMIRVNIYNIWYLSQMASSVLGGLFDKASESYEILHLFKAAYSDNTDAGNAAAQATYDVYSNMAALGGLDVAPMVRTAAVFKEMANAMGMASDHSDKIAQGLTQLTYDYASLFDMDFETVSGKFQSALSGQTRAIRTFGLDITQASLQQELYAEGINRSITELNRAEKTILIYNTMIRHSSNAQQDFAASIMQPANLMRVLREQVSLLARSFGALLIPAISKVLPYLIAMANALTQIFGRIAQFFGISLPDIGSVAAGGLEGVDDLGESLDDAEGAAGRAGKAMKKLRDYTLGFDELNIFRPDDSGSGGGGGVGGGGGGGIGSGIGGIEPLDPYDFLGGLKPMETILNSLGDGVKRIASEWLEMEGAVSRAFKAIGDSYQNAVSTGAVEALGVSFTNTIVGMIRIVREFATGFRLAWEEAGRGDRIVLNIVNALRGVLDVVYLVQLGIAEWFTSDTGQYWIGKVLDSFDGVQTKVIEVTDEFKRIWSEGGKETFQEKMLPVLGQLLDTLFRVAGAVVGIVGEFINWGLESGFLGAISDTLRKIIQYVGDVAVIFEEWWTSPESDNFKNRLKNIADRVKEIVDKVEPHLEGLPGLVDKVSAAVDPFVQTVLDFIEDIIENWDDIEEAIIKVAEVVEMLGNVFRGVYNLFIKPAISKAIDIIKNLDAYLLQVIGLVLMVIGAVTGKMPLAFAGAAAVIAGKFVVIKRKWQDLVDSLANLTRGLVEGVKSAFTSMQNVVGNIWTAITTAGSNAMTAVKNVVTSGMAGASNAFNNFRSTAQDVFNRVRSSASTSMATVRSIVSSIGSSMGSSMNSFRSTTVTAFNNIARAASSVFGGIRSTISGAFNGITSSIRSSVNGVINAVNSAIRGLNRIRVPSWVPGLGGRGISFPQVPRLAQGGLPNMGSLFAAGEAGPELIGQFGGNPNTVMPLENSGFVEAVASSVYTAVRTAMSEVEIDSSTGDVYLDAVKVGRVMNRSNAVGGSMGSLSSVGV